MPGDRTDFSPGCILDYSWGRLSYDTDGGGRPLFFLHGFGRSRHDWASLIPHFSHCRYVIPDLRGHGGSDIPNESFSLADLCDDCIRLADTLWLGAFDILAHGAGGLLALECLRLHPERIGRVALLEGWPAAFRSHDTNDLRETLSRDEMRGIRNAYFDTFVRWMPGIRENYWNALDEYDASELLRETQHPILAVYGDGKKKTPEELGLPRRETIRLHVIEPQLDVLRSDALAAAAPLLMEFFELDKRQSSESSEPPPTLKDLLG